MVLRTIVPLVGMPTGRKYKKFRALCRELGILPPGTKKGAGNSQDAFHSQ